ncbi:MAG: ROK family protein [Solirubrobacterales bacterium]|nr:ROK family protein [Solirubrobacterales bacterium]
MPEAPKADQPTTRSPRPAKASNLRGGIDLGGTKIQAIVIDDAQTVMGQARRPTPTKGGPQDVVDAMAEVLNAAADAAGVTTSSLRGVGVGSPGVIDHKAGTVANAGNLPDWKDPFPVVSSLGGLLGTKVEVGNDVDTATQGEFELGAATDYKSILGVFWGTGIGGGIILNGKPWFGRGAAGEIGHVVINEGGRRCTCGRRGCMEAYAGRMAMEIRARKLHDDGKKTDLFKIMEKRGRPRLTSGVWARAMDHGDDLAKELLDEAVVALGAGVGSCVNVLDIEAVVIGGGMGIRFGQPFVDRIEAAMIPHILASDRPPAVLLGALGDLGGAIGASLLIK